MVSVALVAPEMLPPFDRLTNPLPEFSCHWMPGAGVPCTFAVNVTDCGLEVALVVAYPLTIFGSKPTLGFPEVSATPSRRTSPICMPLAAAWFLSWLVVQR